MNDQMSVATDLELLPKGGLPMFSRITRCLCVVVGAVGLVPFASAETNAPTAASAETIRWFQETEQALMDSVALGQKDPWDRVMDPSCVYTSEEGEVMDKQRLLSELRPLPPGLTGGITVKDLTVQEFPDFAVVRYLADEWESVF